MKYSGNIKQVIIESIEKDNSIEGFRREINRVDNKMLLLILVLHTQSLQKYINILKDDFSEETLQSYKENCLKLNIGGEFGNSEIIEMIRKFGLNTDERREKYKNRVYELKDLLRKSLDGDKESYKQFKDLYWKYTAKDNENKFSRNIARGLVLSLVRDKEDILELTSDIKNKIKVISNYGARNIISNIKTELEYLFGWRRKNKKNAKELINDVKSLVEDNTDEDNEEDKSIKSDNIENLKLEIEQYKSSLKLIQQNLQELSEKIDEEVELKCNEKIKDFFMMLNSSKYGNFLDKIPLVEETLKNIKQNDLEREIPSDVKRVLIFIKAVIKFIKDQEIEPIKEVNSVFEGKVEDILEMDYNGEPFIDDEVKKLRIVASGYKYKDMIISIPKVEEVK